MQANDLSCNMYPFLLSLHSLVRWFVVLSLAYATWHAWRGWKTKRGFTKRDNAIRMWTASIAHIQLVLGLWLYSLSPFVHTFFRAYPESIHEREIRFFGLEHIFMMVLSIVLITIGSIKTRRRTDDVQKFRTMYVWFGIALLLIILSIPWQFSPFTSRPYWRGF